MEVCLKISRHRRQSEMFVLIVEFFFVHLKKIKIHKIPKDDLIKLIKKMEDVVM